MTQTTTPHVRNIVEHFESLSRQNSEDNPPLLKRISSKKESSQHNTHITSTSAPDNFEENRNFFEIVSQSSHSDEAVESFAISKDNVKKLIDFFSEKPKQKLELINFARKIIKFFEKNFDTIEKHGYSHKEIKALTEKINSYLNNNTKQETSLRLKPIHVTPHENTPINTDSIPRMMIETPNIFDGIRRFFGFDRQAPLVSNSTSSFEEWVRNPVHLTKRR